MTRILLIDDDAETLEINGAFLTEKGYEVLTADSAEGGIKLIRTRHPACIVMDIMMPGMDGFTALERIREITAAPVLLLTGKAAEEDRIRGLSMGAKDYIVKPYSLEELALRIRIHTAKEERRPLRGGMLRVGPLRIDPVHDRVYCADGAIALTKQEFALLLRLVERRGKLVTFEQLAVELFGAYSPAERKNVMVCASRLRKKIRESVGVDNLIETVWGEGYKFP